MHFLVVLNLVVIEILDEIYVRAQNWSSVEYMVLLLNLQL
jgi:hypothetical protein